MRKFINILILVVALIGSVSAQSLDDLRKKAYDASIEAVNKGKNRKSAYEEYLEKQEIEAAKKAEEENYELLKASAIDYPIEHKVWVKCYCYPCKDYAWYTLFIGDDGDLWINIRFDDNGELGDVLYSTKTKSLGYTKAIDDISGKESVAIKLTSVNNKYTIFFMQDFYDPEDFAIAIL